MSALMASKLAAIFLRGTRGVGKAVYSEKGRDIYDLLWYMNKKAIPDLDYLRAKEVKEAKNLRMLFNKLTIKMNAVSDENLKQDLLPLFVNRTYIENWIGNWRESYLRFSQGYKINVVMELDVPSVHQDFRTDNFYFHYLYKTEEKHLVRIIYVISDYWIDDVDFYRFDSTTEVETIKEMTFAFLDFTIKKKITNGKHCFSNLSHSK
jgi:hypothetical protein